MSIPRSLMLDQNLPKASTFMLNLYTQNVSTDLFEYCKYSVSNLLVAMKSAIMVTENKIHRVNLLFFGGEWCMAWKGIWMMEIIHLGHKGLKRIRE